MFWDLNKSFAGWIGNEVTGWEDFSLVDRKNAMVDVVVVDLAIDDFFNDLMLMRLHHFVCDGYCAKISIYQKQIKNITYLEHNESFDRCPRCC
jgi:hypothetical protein